jgi:uncharacterized protein YccT (UPF0319 family)
VVRSYIILFFLVYLTACSAIEKDGKQEVWQVVTVSSGNLPVKAGMTMILQENSLTLLSKEQSFVFSILKSNDRLVLETNTSRLLFRIEKSADSTMTLHELYSSFPQTISFIKTTNHKKHK